MPKITTVLLYAALTGFSLILGVIIGTTLKISQKIIAAIMAFGSGVLICALTFGLMEEAFKHGGFDAIIIGFLSGGLVFISGDFLIHRLGGRNHKRKAHFKSTRETNGQAIVLGSLLDGVPESIALGVALLSKNGIGLLMLVAIFLSNLPESLSSIDDLQKEGFSKRRIYLSWSIVSACVASSVVLSFLFLEKLDLNALGIIEAFASGAILAMLADSMMPEAYEDGGFLIGFLTMLGFLTAFILSKI
ncbi:MAG: ZIP family zinc transporter [Acidobacteria bacterium]|nr:ZIP family zinc transporter [Acidobacteriota bacterium]MBE3129112.1 ZIP family zinc transporter [Acidobacteriota bacterium]